MMENKEIQKILPHRWPFLLVDRMMELEPGKRGVGIKNLTPAEWCFSRASAYPTVLLLESLAQVGGIVLGARSREENPDARFIGLFAGISEFEFLGSAQPGDRITLKVEMAQKLSSIYRFNSEAFVGDEKIAGGQILLSFSPAG
ncbi:MAG TPA: 3-hydroxyacyl-[acyl-carrier-protein] dehydratase FabZ [Thermodesulfobacteriota bacterium]|nr:3-hydroxyacyl-[acyl-carrier-protein] dehydratase FabZ [Thermodesulfobacteriota bacterium]